MRKWILTEEQLRLYKKFLAESEEIKEGSYTIPIKKKREIDADKEALAKDIYGDDYGTQDEKNTKLYGVDVKRDANIGQLFSIGNQKLSPDTLIINFTSALGCPSMFVCPITQKACYAVAGENRLPDVRRKNLMVQNLWRRAAKDGKVNKIFDHAFKYITALQGTKHQIKFIRFNEAGDFPSQQILDAAAIFAKQVAQAPYNVMSMAYTANKNLNFTKEIDGEPIDHIIKINASRNDIKLSNDITKQNFFATKMDFNSVLQNNDKVEEISDSEANRLKCLGTKPNANGINSIPNLAYGKWNGGEGWYYVCPCSFWKFNKDKAEELFYEENGYCEKGANLSEKERIAIRSTLTDEELKRLKKILNKVKSPCGRECAVCHDNQGGITPDGQIIKDYAVLTATHGSGKGNYNDDYATKMRNGEDNTAIYDKSNVRGLETKYDKGTAAKNATDIFNKNNGLIDNAD